MRNKQVVRLTESRLKRIITESIREGLSKQTHKVCSINEANTSRFPRYRGIPGTKFIYGGSMSGSVVVYKRHRLYEDDVEEALWQPYKDYGYEEIGQKEPTYEGFKEWIEKEDKDYLKSYLYDLIWALDGNN